MAPQFLQSSRISPQTPLQRWLNPGPVEQGTLIKPAVSSLGLWLFLKRLPINTAFQLWPSHSY